MTPEKQDEAEENLDVILMMIFTDGTTRPPQEKVFLFRKHLKDRSINGDLWQAPHENPRVNFEFVMELYKIQFLVLTKPVAVHLRDFK